MLPWIERPSSSTASSSCATSHGACNTIRNLLGHGWHNPGFLYAIGSVHPALSFNIPADSSSEVQDLIEQLQCVSLLSFISCIRFVAAIHLDHTL